MTNAQQRMSDLAPLLDRAQAEQAQLEQELESLARQSVEIRIMEERLDDLGRRLCPRGCCGTELDALFFEVDVLLLLTKLVPSEIMREKRAREALLSAEKSGRACLKIMRDVLQMSINLGMANDNRDRLFPGLPSTLTKRSMPLFLRAKVCLGEFYTRVSRARMRQPLVLRAPVMDLADLTRLPGKKNNPFTRDDMQKSIETSYTQCQHVCNYAQSEARFCLMRERALKSFLTELDESIRAAMWRIRKARAYILELDPSAAQLALAHLMDELPKTNDPVKAIAPPRTLDAEDDDGNEIKDADDIDTAAELGSDSDGEVKSQVSKGSVSDTRTMSSVSLASTMTAVSVMSATPELYGATIARLHAKTTAIDHELRTDQDDEDLPWHSLALGF